MIIQIIGEGEKRAVVYPLLHLLNHFNGGTLISNDGMYRRVITNTDGFIGNIKICISADAANANLREQRSFADAYDIAVRDTGDLIEETGAVIRVCRACDTADKAKGGEYLVYADFLPPANKKPFIPLALPLLRELRDIEVSGRLGAFRNRAAIKALCPIFADIFHVPEITIKNLLRKGIILT